MPSRKKAEKGHRQGAESGQRSQKQKGGGEPGSGVGGGGVNQRRRNRLKPDAAAADQQHTQKVPTWIRFFITWQYKDL